MSYDLTLFGVGTSRTMRAHWMLLELGLDYESHPIQSCSGETLTDEFKPPNLRHKIPVLQHGKFVLKLVPSPRHSPCPQPLPVFLIFVLSCDFRMSRQSISYCEARRREHCSARPYGQARSRSKSMNELSSLESIPKGRQLFR